MFRRRFKTEITYNNSLQFSTFSKFVTLNVLTCLASTNNETLWVIFGHLSLNLEAGLLAGRYANEAQLNDDIKPKSVFKMSRYIAGDKQQQRNKQKNEEDKD